MNKNNDNKIKLTFHPAEFGAKMPIPLAEQSVKAGFPSPAQDYMEGEIDLNDILIRHREATFYVRVSGDSMKDAGILDGDLLVVDRSVTARHGDTVIACVDGEFTVKILQLTPNIALLPANANYQPILFQAEQSLEIFGVVTFVIHKQCQH